MQFKVMTYNLWRGLCSKEHILEPERLAAAQHVVSLEKPDLLALTEACYGGPNSTGMFLDYQNLFGYPYGFFGGYDSFQGGDWGGNMFLSRFPFGAEVFFLGEKSAIRAKVVLPIKTLYLDIIHPSESWPEQEKIKLLEPLLALRKDPYILTGDFNSLSHRDCYNKEILFQELLSLGEFSNFQICSYIDEKLSCAFISWLSSQGIKDTLKNGSSTIPTTLKWGKPVYGMRIDYCFTSGLHVLDAYVVRNQYTELASDHYPVVSILEF